ncbi:MAG: flavodoxin [Desulfovibrio sp.]|nr:flavodoxin [Desulfovibrio sp.]
MPTYAAAVIYSSCTGNTRYLAERLATRFALPLFAVKNAADAPRGVPLVLGAWTRRGGPDGRMARFMRNLADCDVFFFCTMAAYVDSPHAARCLARAQTLLAEGKNRLLGHFFCQGRLSSAILAHSRHPMTPERIERLKAAEAHPNETDAVALAEAVRLAFADLPGWN